ncbi:MAG: glycosyltransferase family 39 protein, partial [Candidatus Aureabacteria bacterium]|nr:glycosyltransferase family 39 protein [Candidatus Auribacterota bacterium]
MSPPAWAALCGPWRKRGEVLGIALTAVLLLALHGRFAFNDVFGEQDSARLANAAIRMHYRAAGTDAGYYGYRISPLYVRTLALLLDAGLPISRLPRAMNRINLLAGSIIIFPLYYLVKRLVNSRVSLITIILVTFCPAFWLGSIYGLPHFPAFAFLLASFCLFLRYPEAKTALRRALCAVGASLAFAAALAFKA